MLMLSPTVRVFVASMPIDLHLSFDRLAGLVRHQLLADPLSGHLFVFFNKTRTMLKILCFSPSGFSVYYKRRGRGQFASLWGKPGDPTLKLTMTELSLFLEGANLRGRLPLSPEQICVDRR